MDDDFKSKVIKIGAGVACVFTLLGAGLWYHQHTERKQNIPRLLEEGFHAGQNGDYKKALEKLDAAAALEPVGEEKLMIYLDRGLAYSATGERDKAIADFNVVLGINPKHVNALEQRGTAYDEKGEHDKAIADYTTALAIEPARADLFYNRGVACGFKKDYAKAISDFSEAIRLDPRPSEYLGRGRAYAVMNEFAKAAADFEMAWRTDSKSAEAVLLLARMECLLGDYGKAKENFENSLTLDPDRVETYNDYAWMLATSLRDDARDGAKAVQYAKRACELTVWGDPLIIDTLAAAEAETGDWEQAVLHEKQSIAMMEKTGNDKDLLEGIKTHLALYERQKPFRQKEGD